MYNVKKLKKELIEAIARLDDEKVQALAQKMIKEGLSSQEIQSCLNKGLKKVGEQFECGEYFIADLMFSGMLYRSVLDILPPVSSDIKISQKARIIIGVVERDIHDIGKDIVVGLLRANGFDVTDLGTDVSPQKFVDAIIKYKPQIVLMSGIMHFAQDSMKRTVDAIKKAGLRNQVYILLGGGCVDSTILERIDADAIAVEPIDTVNSCYAFLNGGSNEK